MGNDDIRSWTRNLKPHSNISHAYEIAKVKAEFLGFMVLPAKFCDVENCLGHGAQKWLDWGLDNCMCYLGCLFKMDEILNRLISG